MRFTWRRWTRAYRGGSGGRKPWQHYRQRSSIGRADSNRTRRRATTREIYLGTEKKGLPGRHNRRRRRPWRHYRRRGWPRTSTPVRRRRRRSPASWCPKSTPSYPSPLFSPSTELCQIFILKKGLGIYNIITSAIFRKKIYIWKIFTEHSNFSKF